jgi:hypothetical protein
VKIRRSLLKDSVSVTSYAGETAYGPSYEPAVDVACNIDARRRLVRSSSGDQVVSEVTLFAHPAAAAVLTPQSRVTVLGRDTEIIAAQTHTLRGHATHVEVTLA